MDDKLKIIIIYKRLLNDIYSSLINVPRVHYYLKERVLDDMFKYLEELYLANDIDDKNIRVKRKKEVTIKFKYIASLIRLLNENKILGEKRYISIVNSEKVMLKLMSNWKNI